MLGCNACRPCNVFFMRINNDTDGQKTIDQHLPFKEYMNTLKQKLNRANGIVAKLRYYVTADVPPPPPLHKKKKRLF